MISRLFFSSTQLHFFAQLHGYRGEKLIERLGLGIDGHAAERLAQQRARDNGKLGGVIYQRSKYVHLH